MRTKTIISGVTMLTLGVFIYGALHRAAAVRSANPMSQGYGSANRMAPDFELTTLDKRTFKLSDFRGKPIILNFWATYCGPCRVEMPWLVEIYKQYQPQGLEIVGVSMDDEGEQQKVSDFVREVGVDYTVLIGNHMVGDAYGGARFLPQTFFIDRGGHIAASVTGMKSKSEFETIVKQLLARERL